VNNKISLYNSNNYDYNSINDPNYDIKRQLSVRQAQLDKLNSYDNLSDDQLKRKQSLERTVETLTNKIEKKLTISDAGGSAPKTELSEKASALAPSSTVNIAKANAYPHKTFSEGTVIKKNDAYLKGFFFDAKI